MSQPGSGFYVTEDLLLLDRIRLERSSLSIFDSKPENVLSREACALTSNPSCKGTMDENLKLYDFTYRNLEPGSFPSLEWKALVDDVLLSPVAAACNSYNDSIGEFHLREEIARHIAFSRGVHCDSDQIVIQGGTQPALQNLLMLFDPTLDSVAMENPGYVGARMVFERCGFNAVPCSVIAGESDYVQSVEASNAKIAYTTPSNQFPMGTVLSSSNRKRLLSWAHSTDAYIVEDDYCHELDFQNDMHLALAALDGCERVIYMGTFSKSLSPALRINYLVLPYTLLEIWRTCFKEAYPAVNWLTQETLARYLESDRYSRHIRRMLLRNKKKHEELLNALIEFMGDRINIVQSSAGLHMLVETKDSRSQDELIDSARLAGVKVYGTENYWMTYPHPLENCILIGFSSIRLEHIRPGIERLADAWFGEH